MGRSERQARTSVLVRARVGVGSLRLISTKNYWHHLRATVPLLLCAIAVLLVARALFLLQTDAFKLAELEVERIKKEQRVANDCDYEPSLVTGLGWGVASGGVGSATFTFCPTCENGPDKCLRLNLEKKQGEWFLKDYEYVD
jgi:hypothetical protein